VPSSASRIWARVGRASAPSARSQVISLRPATLVASTTRSRLPRAFSQEPMMRSVEPCVSGRGGTE